MKIIDSKVKEGYSYVFVEYQTLNMDCINPQFIALCSFAEQDNQIHHSLHFNQSPYGLGNRDCFC